MKSSLLIWLSCVKQEFGRPQRTVWSLCGRQETKAQRQVSYNELPPPSVMCPHHLLSGQEETEDLAQCVLTSAGWMRGLEKARHWAGAWPGGAGGGDSHPAHMDYVWTLADVWTGGL